VKGKPQVSTIMMLDCHLVFCYQSDMAEGSSEMDNLLCNMLTGGTTGPDIPRLDMGWYVGQQLLIG
jgi:hypothetical protein